MKFSRIELQEIFLKGFRFQQGLQFNSEEKSLLIIYGYMRLSGGNSGKTESILSWMILNRYLSRLRSERQKRIDTGKTAGCKIGERTFNRIDKR